MNPNSSCLLLCMAFVKKPFLWFQLIMVFLDYFIKIRKYIYFTIEINNSGYYMCHFHEAYVMLYSQFCLCWCRTLWTNSSVNFSVRPNPRKQHRVYHRGTTHLIFQLSIHVLKKKRPSFIADKKKKIIIPHNSVGLLGILFHCPVGHWDNYKVQNGIT